MRLLLAGLLCCYSLVAQAAPVVVLDPGHGGLKAGTKNAAEVYEKQVVLRIARQAKRELAARGVQVFLTRSGDNSLSLAARVDFANRKGAKVFVSIHNNWAPVPERRGVETYILSAHASDDVASALLHAEEAEDMGPVAVGTGGSDLDFILGDLDRTAAHQGSARLAKKIQDRLGKVSGLGPSRGLRQAPFRVLKGADMAAVLVEVGYLSHAVQGRYLASGRGQKAAGKAIAQGVLAYLKTVKNK
jgi:N-acetylmuramoyl-L-alanine amidase